jgi:nucleotide-binding universal stress UspA family protein
VKPGFRTVLCPTDLSEVGNDALDVAYRVVANGGTVHRLHILEPQSEGDGVAEEEAARRRLAAPDAPDGRADVHTHGYVIRSADVAGTIERQARRHAADVIVMSTHGRTGLSRVFLGSIAEDVVRRFDLPVILVRAGEAPAGV